MVKFQKLLFPLINGVPLYYFILSHTVWYEIQYIILYHIILLWGDARIRETERVVAGWHRRWEKGTRYYEARLHPDLWGEWILTVGWGTRGTQLGQVRDPDLVHLTSRG